jgi:hypothetical protein
MTKTLEEERMYFTAHRQFASASGLEELKAVHVRLPSGSLVAECGTLVYPATVWDKNKLLVFKKYYVSTDGTVWSDRQNSLKKLSPCKSGRVGVTVDGEKRNFFMHRVVASTFLSGIRHAGQNEVDHIDVDNKNNELSNLRWATSKQNISNRNARKAVAHRKRTSDLHSKPVQQLCPETGAVVAEYPSATAAAEATGCSRQNISDAIAKKRKMPGGFSWQFAPLQMTLENFKNRGFEVVGGFLEEAPYLYFSADLQVYNDDKIGKMYEIPINHGNEYPKIEIGGSTRNVHIVVAALRLGYASLAAFDEYVAANGFVVMHDEDANKNDWWNTKLGTRSENGFDAVRNGCNAGKSAARPVVIRLSPDPMSEIWKYNADGGGINDAKFSSFSEAARTLAHHSDLKNLATSIAQSARKGYSFSLKNGQKAWAFA